MQKRMSNLLLLADTPLCLPDFYLEHVPIAGLSQEG